MTAAPKGNASGGATAVRSLAVRKAAARAASCGKQEDRARGR